MNKLAKSLLVGLLENESEVVALYGGGFKPPTKGHFEVAQRTLQEHPEITKLYIVIGSGVRNNITTDESLSIWSIYKKYLSDKIEIVTTQSPLKYIKNYLENNPESKTYVVLGTREGNESDIKDFTQRKEFFEKYGNNIDVLNIVTGDEISGTKARKGSTQSKEEFLKYIPDQLTDKEKDTVYNAILSVIKEDLTPNSNFNYHLNLKDLTGYMIGQGLKIQPLPKVKIISNDVANANDFFGKTAYYNPDKCEIVLFTCNRHPKDIMRSFAHEMIHHAQNLEGRIGGGKIQTTNTHEDGYLKKIEAEAFLHGNMLFRGWTDSAKDNRLHESLLTEGRYDKISNQVSSDIFKQWKNDFEQGISKSVYGETYIAQNLEFRVEATLIFKPKSKTLKVDGGLEENGDENIIYVDFEIDPELLSKMWSEISMNLKDVIRHEIEHLTQSDIENYPSKYMESDQLIRDLINAKLLPTSQYFKLEKEVDAQLQGMYFRAKKEKIPLIDVLTSYLDTQNITPEQKEEILDIWRTRAKALSLPSF
jgi:phosphopantetheine adenylyltransferase